MLKPPSQGNRYVKRINQPDGQVWEEDFGWKLESILRGDPEPDRLFVDLTTQEDRTTFPKLIRE